MGESNREEIAKLEALYANNPGGRVFTHLAEAYRKAGELDRARRILDDGLVRHSDSASAHVVLGRVLLDQGETPEASSAFRRVLELDPENRVALRTLGDLNRKSGSRVEALDYYQKLQHLDPGDDELARLIEDLGHEPQPETAREAVADAAVESSVEAAAPPGEEAEPEATSAPVAEVAEPDQAVSSDFALDWTAAEPESQEQLPGDLAEFVEHSEFVSEEVEETTAELPLLEEVAPEDDVPDFATHSSFEEVQASSEPEPEAEEPRPEEREPWRDPEPWAPEKAGGEPEPWATHTEPEPWAQSAPEPWTMPEPEPDEPVADVVDEMPSGAADAVELWADEDSPAEVEEPWSESIDISVTDEEPWAAEAWTDSVDLVDSGPTDELTESSQEPELPSLDLTVDPAAEEARESSFEQMLSSNQLGEPRATEEGDLPTETLAELYRTQGFYDRAREVYRALLETRPDDLRLQARLREVENLQRGVVDSSAGFTDDAQPAVDMDEDAREAWMAGVASAWTGQSTSTPAAAPGLYSWDDEPADGSDGGPTLREYLNRLLSWRSHSTQPSSGVTQGKAEASADEPAGDTAPAQPEASITESASGSDQSGQEPEPIAAETSHELEIQHDVPVLTLDEEVNEQSAFAVGLMEWEEPAAEQMAAEPPAELVPSEAVRVDEPAPETPPKEAPPSPLYAAARPNTGNPVEDAFDEWFDGADDKAEPVTQAQPEPVSARATVAEPSEPVEEPAPAAEESDDDLEMFRSWLQSLKR